MRADHDATRGVVSFFRDKGEPYDRVRDACDDAGGYWHSESKAFLVSPLLAPQAIEALKTAGFHVTGNRAVVAAVRAEVEAASTRERAYVHAIGDSEERALMPHQREAARFLAARRAALLSDDMGLGKTREVLAALAGRRDVIVLAPASVCSVWCKESDAIGAVVQSCARTALVVKSLSPMLGASLQVISHDAGRALPSEAPPGVALVLDEAHQCTGQTARGRAVAEFAGAVLANGGSAWAMTATPLRNGPLDLWGLLCAFGLERDAFGSFGGFLRAFRGQKDSYGYTFRQPNDFAVARCLRRVSLRRDKSVLGDLLPPLLHDVRRIELSAEGVRAIDAEIASAGLDVEQIEALAIGDDDADTSISSWIPVRRAIALAKVVPALEFLTENRRPFVVFTTSPDAARAVAAKAPGKWSSITGETATKDRGPIVDAFQRGDLDGVALTIRCGGAGLTLTAASDVLFLDRDWSIIANRQAESRVHRLSQTRPVTIFDLYAEHRAERAVWNVLKRKRAGAEAVASSAVSHRNAAPTPLDFARAWLIQRGAL